MSPHEKLVQKRFSNAARGYEEAASIQTGIAADLLGRITLPAADGVVVDIGCGTGSLITQVKELRRDITAIGLDLAPGMLQHAARHKNITLIEADAARLPFLPDSIDLAVSSSTYQWVTDLPGAFCEVARALKPNGHFVAALFGRETLCEFFTSLAAAKRLQGKQLASLRRLPSEGDVRQALHAAGFVHAGAHAEIHTAVFKDVLSLLRWVKAIGANALAQDVFLGSHALKEAEIIYRRHYASNEGLQATFEVIWIEAVKG
ncbi:MAG: methyltransferase domain-containing protein [Candidatus Omnitrophica bacterium]|nr:methyltransferase domain-containing protein [Candidatus Omnitrophota bacterium]